ncbi:Histidine kinase domain-containing protein [Sulfidibacter corallicola]|uniref:Histidine kinase domain-containing protein n=1 Tax=Sulfidibacter corallicola TaxID=2818388 RepID=A0A8A4TMU9_SULCO|nr:sensor histidine kinase [Sulfidibacter corallicola]QTD51296.1 hypothetical protein J3U87_02410 [Sulfidibacter corallicola]
MFWLAVLKSNPGCGFARVSPRWTGPWFGLFVLLCLVDMTLAQEPIESARSRPRVKFSKLSLEQGLSQSSVFTVIQDRQGFLWAGTANGLNRYDGFRFDVFRHDPDDPASLPNDWIIKLYLDTNGDLWVATRTGLARTREPWAQKPRFEAFRHDPDDPLGLAHPTVNDVLRDASGRLWVATGGGLDLFDPETGTFRHYFADPNANNGLVANFVTSLHEDRLGALWVGTGGGLTRLAPDRASSIHYIDVSQGVLGREWTPDTWLYLEALQRRAKTLASAPIRKDHARVRREFELVDATRVLLVAMGEGVSQIVDGGRLLHLDPSAEEARTIWDMNFEKTVWAGGAPKNRIAMQCLELQPGRYALEAYSDDSHAPTRWNALAPRMSALWGIRALVVTEQEQASLEAHMAQPVAPGWIAGRFVNSLYGDREGRLWAGTRGAGLLQWDPAQWRFPDFTQYRRLRRVNLRTYSKPARQRIDDLVQAQPMLALSPDHGGTAHLAERFHMERAGWLAVVTQGEGLNDQMFDFGGIRDADGNLWKSDYTRTVHAGGHVKNRFQLDLLRLEKGAYQAYFQADDSHGPNGWNMAPPSRPELWGIRLYPVPEERISEFREDLAGFDHPDSLAGNFVRGLVQDRQGSLWIATSDGLSELDPNNRTFVTHRHDPRASEGLSISDLQSVFEDRAENLWIGSVLGGLNRFNRRLNQFNHHTASPAAPEQAGHRAVQGFAEDRRGLVWIATGGGLRVYDSIRNQHLRAADSQSIMNRLKVSITDVMVDREQRLWIATRGAGLLIVDPERVALEDEHGNPIRVPPGEERIEHYSANPRVNGLPTNVIWTLHEDRRGEVWVGTWGGGLCRYKREEGGNFQLFYQARDAPITLGHNIVRAVYDDRQGWLWVGTEDGLVAMIADAEQPTGYRFQRYRNRMGDPTSISHNLVTSFYQDPQDDLWIGTYGGGLCRLPLDSRESGRFQRYTIQHGLPNNVVYGILPDDRGGLWMSTNKGVCRFDPRGFGSKAFQAYGVADGLQSNEFNTNAAFMTQKGVMLFGGPDGFNMFHPEQIHRNPYPPPVLLTGVKVFGERLDLERRLDSIPRLELPYRDNFFTLEFAALDFTNPSKNRFAYKLDGFHDEWIEVEGRRQADFTNLDPGDYVFRLKAANNDGVWNERAATLAIHIVPPFWRTLWFRTLVACAAILGLLSLIRLRLVGLKREKDMQVAFSKRLIQTQEHERRRIAAELHDGLGQNLLVIHHEIQHGLTDLDEREEAPRVQQLNELSDLVLHALDEVRQISYDLHPHQLDRLGLERAVESVVNKVERATPIRFDLEIDPIDALFAKEVEINFFRIVQEAVANIVRHAEADRGRIRIRREPQRVEVTIEDNGRGFLAPNGELGGFGLTNMRERARLIGGTLEIASKPGEGTTVSLRLPLHSLPGGETSASSEDPLSDAESGKVW